MIDYPKIVPLPVRQGHDNFARRVWWRSFELPAAVTLRTTAKLRPGLAALQENPWQMLAAVCRATSAALTLHPRLNFYTFWGNLIWAGLPPKVCVVLENKDQSCGDIIVAGAHEKRQQELVAHLRDACNLRMELPDNLRRLLPEAAYLVERFSGKYIRNYANHSAPVFLSMLWLDGIEDIAYTPAHSMALYPGKPKDGLMPLTLCFNHQLANARPMGRFLLAIRELLQ